MVSGGIGAVLVAISALLLGLVPILNAIFDGRLFTFANEDLYYLQIIATAIFLVGGMMMATGFMGIFLHYRASTGIIAMVFVLLGTVMLLVFTFLALDHETWTTSHYSYSYYHSEYTMSAIIWIGHIFVGLMAILMGSCLVLIRRSTNAKELCGTAGVLSIVSGALMIGLMGILGIGWIFLSVTCLVVAALFFLARTNGEAHKCQPAIV